MPYPDPPTVNDAEQENAVYTLIQLVKQYPKQITIVAIGPLTNIAMATRLDPTFRENVKAIVWTGGSVRGIGNVKPGIEFNAFMDPGKVK